MDVKSCALCLQTLPVTEFYSSRRDGYYSRCKECQRAVNRDYKSKNAAKIKSAESEYRARNRLNINERARSRYRLDPAEAWRRSYRQRVRSYGFTPIVEEFERHDVVRAYGDGCWYCRAGKFEVLDHYEPVSVGGAHTLANVRPSCASCNSRKGGKIVEGRELDFH